MLVGTETRAQVVLLPSNSGLADQARRALAMQPNTETRLPIQYVRGEDVPFLASQIAAGGRSVFGVTGEDLLAEWLASGNALAPDLQVRGCPWRDARAIFGAPALCLIGPPRAKIETASRIAIPSKYRQLSERFLSDLETSVQRSFERIVISGALETVCLNGLADFIIDIVVTGSTMREAGLEVRTVIRKSNLALLESA